MPRLSLPRSSSSGVLARRGCPPGRGDLLCGGDLEGVPLVSLRPRPQPVPGPWLLVHFNRRSDRGVELLTAPELGLPSERKATCLAAKAACACAKAVSADSRSATAAGCVHASGIVQAAALACWLAGLPFFSLLIKFSSHSTHVSPVQYRRALQYETS